MHQSRRNTSFLRRHFTYANVVATLCLFVVLGVGTATAANTMLTGSSIKDGSITSMDIANGAQGVRSVDIRDGSVAATDLAAGVQSKLDSVVKSEKRPLFVNMTTDDSHRANMALTFATNQLKLGHPVTVFLNDKGVFVGSTTNAATYAAHQTLIAQLIKDGATVYACPMCTMYYKVDASTYVKGIELSNPEKTGAKLFRDGTTTLTW
jgi:predicted peroxiredoxin